MATKLTTGPDNYEQMSKYDSTTPLNILTEMLKQVPWIRIGFAGNFKGDIEATLNTLADDTQAAGYYYDGRRGGALKSALF